MGYINFLFNKMRVWAEKIAALGHAFYGVFVWLVFFTVAFSLLGVVVVLPGQERRRSAARHAARLVLMLTGSRPRISGLQHLPATPCIVAANHASYVDGIVLTAALPARFRFVIKREMTQVPVAHFLLRRIGSLFVERFDTRRGAADARRVLALAESHQSLAFFPEGTFRREPGLRRFQNGAFAAAVRGNVPLVPVVICGSRRMLPAGEWLARPSQLEVIVKPPVHHNGDSDAVATLLRSCRDSILENLPEPDLREHAH
jgi:1-acyl-sn-glycerol-3-phosphate acyltransferase